MIEVPRIIVPKYKDLIVPTRGMGGQAQGRYKLVAIRPDGRERPLTGWFDNLITDVGLERIATTALTTSAAGRCYVGSGNTPPAATDTALQIPVANTSTLQSYTRGRGTVGTPTPTVVYSKFNLIFRFATGVAAGNLSEVGVGTATVGSNLHSRALILDDTGAPTTITVLSDEVLDVYYEHRLYYDLSDYAFSVNISGTVYNGTRRLWSYGGAVDNTWNPEQQSSMTVISNVNAYNGALSPFTGNGPGGSSSQASSLTPNAYVPNTKTRRYVATWDLNSGNLAGGVTAVAFWATAGWTQMSFSPAIPKDNTKTLTMTLDSAPWARYTP